MEDVYGEVVAHFNDEGLELLRMDSDAEHVAKLDAVAGLSALVDRYLPTDDAEARRGAMEFALHGMAAHNLLGKDVIDGEVSFSDLMGNLFSADDED
jgi:magnesium chelatase subunit I